MTGAVPQGLLQDPVLFNTFNNELDGENMCTLSKFAADTKPGGMTDASDGCGSCGCEGPQKAREMVQQEPYTIQ